MESFQNTGQPDWDWWGRLWPTPGATLRKLGITEGTTLAEVPSGNGYFALPAARITDPATVYALELDESLLEELTHLATQQGIDNIEPLHGDARELDDHLPEAVDTILVANTLHGVAQPESFVEKAVDALDEDGRLVIVNWLDEPQETTTVTGEPRGPPTDLRLSPEETTTIVESGSEATVHQRVELPPYHYGLVCKR